MNSSAGSVPPGSVRSVSGTEQAELVSSLRQAAEACNVTPIVVRRWIASGWLHQPRWTLRQIHEVIHLGHQRIRMDRREQGEHAFIVRAGAVVAAAEASIMASRPSFT